MSPRANTRVTTFPAALALCERGKWREASESIADFPAGPERAMIEGCVLALSSPEAAKDVLSEAIRQFAPGEVRAKAQIWLSYCYWATGEAKEAKIILNDVEPWTNDVRFLLGLNRSVFEKNKIEHSLTLLKSVEDLVDEVIPLWRGKFFLQRGWLMRRLAKFDSAILDYEVARYWFEQADSPRHLAATVNNLAGLLIDARRYEDAHAAVDSAIKALPDTDTLYLAQVYDQKALIYIAEDKYAEGLKCAGRSVDMLAELENKEILAASLTTHAKALTGCGELVRALVELDRVREIALYLGDKNILLQATKQQRDTAQKLDHASHRVLVETALEISGGSLRGAARLIGCSAPSLDRFIRYHNIKCNHRVTKSVITKFHK